MYVFLLNESGMPKHRGIPRHRSVVRYQVENVEGASNVPASAAVWTLAEEDLRIVIPGGPTGADLKIEGFDVNLGKVPVPSLDVLPSSDSGHFGWVSSIGDACTRRGHPEASRIDHAFLDPTLTDSRAGVLGGRVLLTTGTIRSFSFLQSDQGVLICRYRPFNEEEKADADDHRQFVAAKVVLTIPIPGDSVRLESRSLRTGTALSSLVLRPSSQTNRVVEIDILNEEADAILDLGELPGFVLGKGRDADRIVESYASLCPGAKSLADRDQLPIPIPSEFRPIPRGNTGPLRSSVPCSPYQLSL